MPMRTNTKNALHPSGHMSHETTSPFAISTAVGELTEEFFESFLSLVFLCVQFDAGRLESADGFSEWREVYGLGRVTIPDVRCKVFDPEYEGSFVGVRK